MHVTKSKDHDRPSLMLVVSPSPRELYALLLEEEKIAIDLLLQDSNEDPDQLTKLVPDTSRLAFLRGLSKQLRVFGFSIGESAQLDLDRETWEAQRAEARKRYEVYEQQQRTRDVARDRDRAWLEALSPEVRRSVERTRRCRARRGGRR